MSSNLTSFTKTKPSLPTTSSPGVPATRSTSVRSVASLSGVISPFRPLAAWIATTSPEPGSLKRYVMPSATVRPSQAGIVFAMLARNVEGQTRSSA